MMDFIPRVLFQDAQSDSEADSDLVADNSQEDSTVTLLVVRQAIVSAGSKVLLQMADMADIIFQYCEDRTLFQLTLVCSHLNSYLLNERPDSRSIKKGFLVRILKFKYSEASKRLQAISKHFLQPQREAPLLETSPNPQELMYLRQKQAQAEKQQGLLTEISKLYQIKSQSNVVKGGTSKPEQMGITIANEFSGNFTEENELHFGMPPIGDETYD